MNRQNHFIKPENALKRADEYINIGNKAGALNLLHDVLSQRRIKTWQKSYESIMLKYIDLCIELLDHARGKDGLHQYRNMCQAQAPGSLEVVIKHYVDLAEARTDAAASVAAARAEAEKVKDLENEQTPETLMMSTMIEASEKDRSDREVLLPWLKFLWETYRSVLDILRSNSKLELVYHRTAERAFNFCSKFKRKTEFRRLCDLLRLHLNNLQKSGMQTPGHPLVNDKKLRGWDGWTPDSIERHLQTRFKQLEVASNLELWAEGFRTVGDIHSIMGISKKPPKAKLMATYYDRLTKIFWVSENYLFHAYAWFKFYTLTEAHNQRLTPEERTAMASHVLLAAISIPNVVDGSAGRLFEDDMDQAKNQQMATLLGFSANPTRRSLIEELLAKRTLTAVEPSVRALYTHLEETFHPLDMVRTVQPALDWLARHESFHIYVKPITKLVVVRCLRQLATVYHTVHISQLKQLLGSLNLSDDELEMIMVTAVKQKQATMRIDHQAKCLRFGDAMLESAAMRTQLTTLATQLNKVVDILTPVANADAVAAQDTQRGKLFAMVRDNVDREHHLALNRKNIIERKKEEEELCERQRIKAEELKRIEEEKAAERAEQARLKDEEERRRVVTLDKIQQELDCERVVNILQRFGRDADTSKIAEMSSAQRDKLVNETCEQATKQRGEEETRLKEQFKRIDYTIRALRDEEIPLIKAQTAKKNELDLAQQRERNAAAREAHRLAWEHDTQRKGVLATMIANRHEFEAEIMAERELAYNAEVNKRRQEAYNRKISRARRRKAEQEEQRLYEEEEAERRREEQEEADRIRAEREEEERRLEEEAAERRRAEEKAEAERQAAEAKRQADIAAAKEAAKARAAEREKAQAEAKAEADAAAAAAAAERSEPSAQAPKVRVPASPVSRAVRMVTHDPAIARDVPALPQQPLWILPPPFLFMRA